MRIVVVTYFHDRFVEPYYAQHPWLGEEPFEKQSQALLDTGFGIANFYELNLRNRGHESVTLIATCRPLQLQWAREHGLRMLPELPEFKPTWRGRVPFVRRSSRNLYRILLAQVEHYKPDVVLVIDIGWLPPAVVGELRARVPLVVGQHASKLPGPEFWRAYDGVISSLPHYVSYFRDHGMRRSSYLQLAFEQTILSRLDHGPPQHGVTHIGGYGVHDERVRLLEHVGQPLNVELWGYDSEHLPSDSWVRQHCRGEVWGLQMHQIRHRSRICLNKHASFVAGDYANNLSLYEIAGVGSCLLTDHKANIGQIFQLDREAITYSSAEECLEKGRYLLDHEEETRAIAAAGQRRVLSEHTFGHRTDELCELLAGWLSSAPLQR